MLLTFIVNSRIIILTEQCINEYFSGVSAAPNGFNSRLNAVKYYTLTGDGARSDYVGGLEIYGSDGKYLTTVSTFCPPYPAQVK